MGQRVIGGKMSKKYVKWLGVCTLFLGSELMGATGGDNKQGTQKEQAGARKQPTQQLQDAKSRKLTKDTNLTYDNILSISAGTSTLRQQWIDYLTRYLKRELQALYEKVDESVKLVKDEAKDDYDAYSEEAKTGKRATQKTLQPEITYLNDLIAIYTLLKMDMLALCIHKIEDLVETVFVQINENTISEMIKLYNKRSYDEKNPVDSVKYILATIYLEIRDIILDTHCHY